MNSIVLPSKWDLRFVRMAELISSWSKDPGSKCGTVIVDQNRVILSYGYNGFPRGMRDTPERLNDRAFKLDHVVHAEENAILNAGRIGTPLLGATLYQYGLPVCHRCAVSVAQSGIQKVVQFCPPKMMKLEWQVAWEKSRAFFEEVGITVVMLDTKTGDEA